MNSLVLTALLLSVFITTFNLGYFTFSGLTLLICLFIILIILYFRYVNKFQGINFMQFLPVALIAVYSLYLFYPGGIYETNFLMSILLRSLPILIFPLILTYTISEKKLSVKQKLYRYYFLILMVIFMRILMIISSAHPTIDVFNILKEAPLKLLHGQNPYDTVYSPAYKGAILNYYPYWPASFFLEMPFVFLFGDPRILLILSDVASALLLFIIGKKKYSAEILSLIYLLRPNSNFIIEQSWTTPLIFLLTLLCLYFAREKKDYISGLFLGLLVSVQSYYIFLLPFLLLFSYARKKMLTIFGAVLGILVLPFFLWNPDKFMDKTIYVYFKPVAQIPTIPVHLSLNLNTAYFILAGKDISLIFTASIFLPMVLAIFLNLYKNFRNGIKNRFEIKNPIFFLSITLFIYSFYIFFRQSFINYYYYAGSLLILWLVQMENMEKINIQKLKGVKS